MQAPSARLTLQIFPPPSRWMLGMQIVPVSADSLPKKHMWTLSFWVSCSDPGAGGIHWVLNEWIAFKKRQKRLEENYLVNGTSKARICVTFTRICLRNRKIKYNLWDSMRDLGVPLRCKWHLRFLRFYAA